MEKLTLVFRDTLDNEALQLTEQSTASEVDDWDSLNHVQLVVAIEHDFHIRFNSVEIQTWKNVGEMIDSIQAKIPA